MIISDLNYLESADSSAVVGGFNLGYDFSKIYFSEYFSIKKDVYVDVDIDDNLATAEADAYGNNTLTQTFATVIDGKYSNSVSIAAAD